MRRALSMPALCVLLPVFALAVPLLLASRALAQSEKHPRLDAHGDPLPSGAVARLGALDLRHPGEIYCLAFSPDGKAIASAGGDFTVRLWDAETGKQRGDALRHTTQPVAVDFSALGLSLVSAEWGGKIVHWHVPSASAGAAVRLGSAEACHACRFCPDGSGLLTIDSSDGLVSWDREGKRLGAHPIFKTSWLKPVFSPDARLALNNKGDRDIRVWDVATGKARLELGPHKEEVEVAVFCPLNKHVASAGRGNPIHLWDLDTGKLIRTLPDKAERLLFSPDGKILASAARDTYIQLWDVASGAEIRRLEGHEQVVTALAFSRDGKRLASGGWGGMIRVWDVAGGKESLSTASGERGRGEGVSRPQRGFESATYPIAFSPDGKSLVFNTDRGVHVWDLARPEKSGAPWKLQPRQHIPLEWTYRTPFLLAPDGLTFAGPHRRHLTVWDLAGGAEKFKLIEGATTAAFSPDGAWLAAAYSGIHLWSTRTGKPHHPAGKPVIAGDTFAFAPDGQKLATLVSRYHKKEHGKEEEIEEEILLACWEPRTGTMLRQFPIQRLPALRCRQGEGGVRLHFSPTGRTIAICSGHVELWDVGSGRCPLTMPLSLPFAFSPDGKHVAGLGPRREGGGCAVQLLELASGAVVEEWPGHGGEIANLVFSPDGRLLASGGTDSTILLWDVRPGTPLTAPRPAAALDAPALSRCWEDLAGVSGPAAREAIAKLTTDPAGAVAFLDRRLAPAAAISREQVLAWIDQLGATVYREREEALEHLKAAGAVADPHLLEATRKKTSPERERRIEKLLRDVEFREVEMVNSEARRLGRAIQALEAIATPDARKLLERLAAGAPGADLTRDAQAALRRLP